MMKHSIRINGIAKPGDGRGRALGFPTANLAVSSEQQLPLAGVYAAWARLDDESEAHPAAVHIGPRPTFNDATQTIEVHLLDFPDRDLYGRSFAVDFVKHLRGIKKFATSKELSEALTDDCQRARVILQNQSSETPDKTA